MNELSKEEIFKNFYGYDFIKDIIYNIIKNKELPNLILYGDTGTGKSTILKIIIKNLYHSLNSNMVLYLNINNDRGINTVRNKIKDFSNNQINNNDKLPKFKLIVFEQADYISIDAQNALRRIIETTCNLTRFIFIVNNLNNIIDPIESRCLVLRFLSTYYTDERTKSYIKKYKEINESIIKKIVKDANGNIATEIKNINYILSIKDDNQKNSIINNIILNKNFCFNFKNMYKLIKNTKNISELYNLFIDNLENINNNLFFKNFYKYLLNNDEITEENKKLLIKYYYKYNLNKVNKIDKSINNNCFFIKIKRVIG